MIGEVTAEEKTEKQNQIRMMTSKNCNQVYIIQKKRKTS